ncbi:alpha/beta hydrolase [Azotobacter salinestris]|uniref:alpha/beta hydrolase n=1 Tax=Azotobacter salinestris TaxID=69964 RepID=UPI0032DFC4B5
MSKSRLLRLSLPLFVGAALAACAGRPEPPGAPGRSLEQQLEGAYRPATRLPVRGWDAEWQVAGQAVEVSWMAPEQARGAPLILYLPGLGEGSRGGAQWRRAWAEAGYAVLSVQPQQYGRAIYSSPEAQAGVFRSLAQKSFADKALAARIAVLEQVLAELRSRAQAGEPSLAGVDWQTLAVAGFDLGAQTAAALAGERAAGEAVRPGWQPKAAILLSPYVAGEGEDGRFGRIGTPLLALTGPRDEDPFGWVEPPSRRQRLWQELQVPGSYQLIAGEASHRLLSGSFEEISGPGGGREGGRPPGDRPKGGGGAGGPGAGGPGGGGSESGGRSGRPGGKGGDPGGGGRLGHGQGPEERADPRQMASLLSLSLAFLDARVRDAAPARLWLERDAAQWLAPAGRLEQKP